VVDVMNMTDSSIEWRPQFAEILTATETTVTVLADWTEPDEGCWGAGECAFRLDRALYHAALDRYLDTRSAGGNLDASITFKPIELLSPSAQDDFDEDAAIDALVDRAVFESETVSEEEFMQLLHAPSTGPSTPSRVYGSTAATEFQVR
jgi:hypothetical protein